MSSYSPIIIFIFEFAFFEVEGLQHQFENEAFDVYGLILFNKSSVANCPTVSDRIYRLKLANPLVRLSHQVQLSYRTKGKTFRVPL
jgi:hypothetical protein